MKVFVQALILSLSLTPALGLAIDREALVERGQSKQGKVVQNANSGNEIWQDSSAGAGNGDTTAGSFFGGGAIAVPIAVAKGGSNDVSFGDALNKNKASSKKVVQNANSGNYINQDSSAVAVNGDTKAVGGKGAVAIPIAAAKGGSNKVTFGDATNTNDKRNQQEPKKKTVKQNANSGNVVKQDSSGYAENGDTSSGGLVAVAVPVAVGLGGSNDATFKDAKNINKNGKATKVSQNANSGNAVLQDSSGTAVNGDTKSNGGLVGVAIPVAVAKGGSNSANFGDAVNVNH